MTPVLGKATVVLHKMQTITWLLIWPFLNIPDIVVATYPVVLVVLDGFRSDYLSLYPTPQLDKIASKGVVVPSLIPEFPASK